MASPPPAGSVTSDAGGDLGAAVESLKKVPFSPTQTFERDEQLSELLRGPNLDALQRNLAILVSRRGV
ncbi:hypothetical protein HK405_009239, partial [Cladochytrium tenue]